MTSTDEFRHDNKPQAPLSVGVVAKQVLIWVTTGCVAGLIVGALEVSTMAIAYPGVLSSVPGVFQLWLKTSMAFSVLGVFFAPLLAVADSSKVRRALPSDASYLSAIFLAIGATFGAALLGGLIDFNTLEFDRELRVVVFVINASWIIIAIFLYIPIKNFIHARLPNRLHRAVRIGLLTATSVAAVLGSHFVFAAIHHLTAALILGAVSVCLMVLVLFPLIRGVSRRTQALIVGTITFFSLFGLYTPGAARDHARYMLFSHGAASARFAEIARNLVDMDGDGSASVWLGGTDCAEWNASIGPAVTEIPGDGIDQDCRGGDAPESPTLPSATLPEHCRGTPEPLSVLLIIIDALRGDHFTPELMPGLTELARASTVFLRAYSPTPLTVTSFPSLLSARPVSDLVRANPLVDDEFIVESTLPERFQDHGYQTAIFSHLDFHAFSNRGFNRRNDYWRDESLPNVKFDLTSAGMARGVFDYFDHVAAQPVFVMLHLSDVHAPYPAQLVEDLDANDREAYALGVSYTDLHLQQLFARMQHRGWLQKTIIIVTSDHGEELALRGRHGHGHNTYEEGIRVPLVIWAPNCGPRVERKPVSTRQIGPTVGALTGVEVPGMGLFSQSELPLVIEGAMKSTIHYKHVVIQDNFKLVVDVPNGGKVLFDLARDPMEQNNIYGKEPDLTLAMESAYQRWLDAAGNR